MEIGKMSRNSENVVGDSVNPQSFSKVLGDLKLLESEELMTAPLYQLDLDKILSTKPFFLRIIFVTAETNPAKITELIQTTIQEQNLAYLARFEIAVIAVRCQLSPEAPLYHKVIILCWLVRLFQPLNFRQLSNHGEIFLRWYDAQSGLDILEAMKHCITLDLRLSRTIVTDSKGILVFLTHFFDTVN